MVLAANFSLMCLAHRMVYGLYSLWAHVEQTAPHLLNERPAKGFFLETSCKVPWSVSSKRQIGRVSRIRDLAASYLDIVAPAVITKRFEQYGALREESVTNRRLLFFAGHIPKLYISTLRYEIWRQLRRVSDATAISHTINCSVLAWAEICQDTKRLADGKSHETFCRASCPNQPKKGRIGAACSRDERSLRRVCSMGKLRSVDVEAERAALARENGQFAAWQSPSQYARQVMSHRFCLAAQGDGLATPKATEFIFAASAGGCIPVFVIPDCRTCSPMGRRVRVSADIEQRWQRLPAGTRAMMSAEQLAIMEAHMARIMPFSRWKLNYCDLGIIVPSTVARRNVSAVLHFLRHVRDEELAPKRKRCAEAAKVLTYRADDRMSDNEPGAISHILSELCQVSRGGLSNVTVPPLDETCLVGRLDA